VAKKKEKKKKKDPAKKKVTKKAQKAKATTTVKGNPARKAGLPFFQVLLRYVKIGIG
jgi:hypothetical protein